METIIPYLLTLVAPFTSLWFWLLIVTVVISIPCRSRFFFIGGTCLLWVSFFLPMSYRPAIVLLAYLFTGLVNSIIQWRGYCHRLSQALDKHHIRPDVLPFTIKDHLDVPSSIANVKRYTDRDVEVKSLDEYKTWLNSKLSIKEHSEELTDFILFWPATFLQGTLDLIFTRYAKFINFLYRPNKELRKLLSEK